MPKAIEINPESGDYDSLCSILTNLTNDDQKRVIEKIQKALENKNATANAYNRLGQRTLRSKKYDEAIEQFKRPSKKTPTIPMPTTDGATHF